MALDQQRAVGGILDGPIGFLWTVGGLLNRPGGLEQAVKWQDWQCRSRILTTHTPEIEKTQNTFVILGVLLITNRVVLKWTKNNPSRPQKDILLRVHLDQVRYVSVFQQSWITGTQPSLNWKTAQSKPACITSTITAWKQPADTLAQDSLSSQCRPV